MANFCVLHEKRLRVGDRRQGKYVSGKFVNELRSYKIVNPLNYSLYYCVPTTTRRSQWGDFITIKMYTLHLHD